MKMSARMFATGMLSGAMGERVSRTPAAVQLMVDSRRPPPAMVMTISTSSGESDRIDSNAA